MLTIFIAGDTWSSNGRADRQDGARHALWQPRGSHAFRDRVHRSDNRIDALQSGDDDAVRGNPRCPASRGSRVGISKQEADNAREDEIYHTAAFLTFLFTRLPVDAKLKTKGTQHRNIDLFGIGPGSRGSTNLRQDHSVRTEATLASLIVPLLGKFSHTGRNIATVKMTLVES